MLYEQIPYATGQYPVINPDNVEAAKQRTEWNIRSSELMAIDLERKKRAIECYRSQLIDIFPDGFGALEDDMATLNEDHAVERLGRVDTQRR
jgi:hypothetical protein